MPEFMYDPSAGQAVQVDPRASYGDVDPTAPSLEQKEENIHSTMARGLASRARNDHGSTAGEYVNLAAEEQLLDLQAEINRETNPIKIEQMQAKAEALAAGLIGAQPQPMSQPDAPTAAEDKAAWHENYKNQNPGVEEALAYAGEVMGDDLAGGFNQMIDSDDEEVRVASIKTVQMLHQNPERFTSAQESTGLTMEQCNEFATEYGQETANQLHTIANAVASGAVSSMQALQTVSKRPALLRAITELAASGRINIAL